jgi:hypothetical protein
MGLLRSGAADVRGGKENRFDAGKVFFLAHPLHEDTADHPSPADESNAQHGFSKKI